tara:strand:+ start:22 stop:663 length:642 start_codon:yes stop_codon:yes gene_type:complete
MCNPAAIAITSVGIGLVGSYYQAQAQKKQAEEYNRRKERADARTKDQLLFSYGVGAQEKQNLERAHQRDIDVANAQQLQNHINSIEAEASERVASEKRSGQSSDLVSRKVQGQFLRTDDAIKEELAVKEENKHFAEQSIKQNMNTARFQAIQQIESTQFMSGPDSMSYLLGAGNTALGGMESYFNMKRYKNPSDDKKTKNKTPLYRSQSPSGT